MKAIFLRIKKIFLSIKKGIQRFLDIFVYMILISTYVAYLVVRKISTKLKFLSPLENFLSKLIILIDPPKKGNISRVELIDLAIRNMTSQKNRLYVTVGGMTIGIAAIVFLVSIGYGLQSLVISRVARLEEMKQTDVTVLPGSNLYLNDDVIKSFQGIPNVKLVLPQIAVVGKVNYNNSLTDMAVYGVTKDYLTESAIAPVIGKAFESNDIMTNIKANKQEQEEITENTTQPTDQQLMDEMIIVPGESDIGDKITISKVIFPVEFKDTDAVVNRGFLKVLGIQESEALNKSFSVSFISTSKSLDDIQSRMESTSVDYTIIGVTPDETTPLFYVPFIHLKSLGITNYSQVKVVVDKEQNLANVRTEIEAQGFATSSVVDTVTQINSLFSVLRTILALVGTIALLVAALGMFNTLTVSLLERTREIGLLKSMGMKSNEVRDLFLAESMTMGLLGGFLGIILGLVIGKILELLLSIYGLISGVGSISIINMPILFAVFIIVLSFLVGVLTGVYPAKRATRISALNALRYE